MTITLSEAEIVGITGYTQPKAQVEELRRQGFFRARKSPATGKVILEREHFNSVCRGGDLPERNQRPQVRAPQPRLRAAA